MCGFLGAISSTPAPLDLDSLRAAIGHRGPDSAGIKTLKVDGKNVVLGHVRLSILDISEAGAQPMASRDGRWLITYNGEIYNHSEIRSELGGPFRSDCDTETLVEALSNWGVDATIARLNGIFAFAALDRLEGRLYMVRDRSGIKPLYYQQVDDGLAFASEVRGLKLLTKTAFRPDPVGLGMFLTYRYTPSPHTLWSGVSRVAPGHLVDYSFADGRLSSRCYILPQTKRFTGSEEEATACYTDILTQAVARQLLSDVPVGVLLSGGMDSAVIAALAVKAGASPTAFTVGFGKGHPECEIAYARHTAKTMGLKHRIVTIGSERAWDALIPALSSTEEPLGTTSLVPMWYLSALAREDVSVVLTGQGTDELFGGYRRYQGELLRRFLPHGALWGPLATLARYLGPRGNVLERASRSLSTRDEALQMANVHALFSVSELRALGHTPDDAKRLAPLRSWLAWVDAAGYREPVERMMAVDMRMNLADDLLLYGDRISMAHSIEARVPMLDNSVVDFVETLPRHLRVRWRGAKHLHRIAAMRLLDKSIVERPKLGFQVPVGTWALNEWRERIEARLFHGKGFSSLVDPDGVRMIWEEHQSRRRDRTRQIFALLALSAWAESWIDNP